MIILLQLKNDEKEAKKIIEDTKQTNHFCNNICILSSVLSLIAFRSNRASKFSLSLPAVRA